MPGLSACDIPARSAIQSAAPECEGTENPFAPASDIAMVREILLSGPEPGRGKSRETGVGVGAGKSTWSIESCLATLAEAVSAQGAFVVTQSGDSVSASHRTANTDWAPDWPNLAATFRARQALDSAPVYQLAPTDLPNGAAALTVFPLEQSGAFARWILCHHTVEPQKSAAQMDLAVLASAAIRAMLPPAPADHQPPEAAALLEAMLAVSREGTLILGRDGRIVAFNKALAGLFPVLDGLAPGMTAAEAQTVMGEDLALTLGFGLPPVRVLKSGEVKEDRQTRTEVEITLPDGRAIRRQATALPDGGRLLTVVEAGSAGSERSQLEEVNARLRKALDDRARAKRRAARVIENAGIGTWEWDCTSGLVRIAGRWAGMLGYTAEELAPLTHEKFLSLLHPDDALSLAADRPTNLNQGEDPFEDHFRLRRKDGSWCSVLSRGRVANRNEAGEPILVNGVHIDLSRQAELERELNEERALTNSILQSSVTAIAVVDDKGTLIYANKEAEETLRLKRSEIEGRQYNDPDWRIERVDGGPLLLEDTAIALVLKTGVQRRDVRHARYWADGTRRIFSVNAAPLMRESGKMHVVASFVDLTNELAATDRLEEARRRAEDASRAKSMFLANMSHEIRTPLNGVLGMAEVLEASITNPDHLRMIGTIRNSGETLLTVLNGILDMSKIEAGKMELELLPFMPMDLLVQTDTVFSVLAEERGLNLDVSSTAGANRMLLGDSHRIQQILNNLMSNAFKFTEKGTVALKMTCRPDEPLTFQISDTGVGMSPEQVARVFDSFVQADGSVTRRFGGTGLGLSIVRELVTLMGGTVDVSSIAGKGTTINVSIPLKDAAELAEPARQKPGLALPSARLDGLCVLIADDNLTNRLVLIEMLESVGAKIWSAEDGRQAVDLWQAHLQTADKFDMLLIDITMPVMDGICAISEVRSIEMRRKLNPVSAVAITGNAMPNQVAHYISAGFDSHLSKPFKKAALVHAILSLLDDFKWP